MTNTQMMSRKKMSGYMGPFDKFGMKAKSKMYKGMKKMKKGCSCHKK